MNNIRIMVVVCEDSDAENDLRSAVANAKRVGADRQVSQLLARSASKITIGPSTFVPKVQKPKGEKP